MSSPGPPSLANILSTPSLRTELDLLVEHCIDNMQHCHEIAYKDSSSPSKDFFGLNHKLRDLHEAYLVFFSQWRSSVLQRVRVALELKPDNASHRNPPAERQNSSSIADALFRLYSIPQLLQLERPQRILLLHAMLLLLLSLEHYAAQSRVLLEGLAHYLDLDAKLLTVLESGVAKTLLLAATKMNADVETAEAATHDAKSRKWKVGLAVVAAATVIGVTGGLAAPALAVGLPVVLGTWGLATTVLSGSSVAIAAVCGALFGAYGGKKSGQYVDKYAREVKDFKFVPLGEERRLRVAIGISGWLTEEEEVVSPWRVLGDGSEVFGLRWEMEALLRLGKSLMTVMKKYAKDFAKMNLLKLTVLNVLIAPLWPLGILKIASLMDNPFIVARERSDKAGKVLADALINRAQGKRPVTLIGFSLGARVIFVCLQTLAKRKAFGLVDNVIMMGAPVSARASNWCAIRTVAAGRVVNVFSTRDYILGCLYRTSSARLRVAGLRAIDVHGVENLNVSDLVSGHPKYRNLVGTILSRMNFGDVDAEELARQEEALRK